MIDCERELRHITCLLPDRKHRRSLAKHLVFLNNEIIERQDRGESTKVMRLSYDCLDQTLEMLDEIKKIKVQLNEVRS